MVEEINTIVTECPLQGYLEGKLCFCQQFSQNNGFRWKQLIAAKHILQLKYMHVASHWLRKICLCLFGFRFVSLVELTAVGKNLQTCELAFCELGFLYLQSTYPAGSGENISFGHSSYLITKTDVFEKRKRKKKLNYYYNGQARKYEISQIKRNGTLSVNLCYDHKNLKMMLYKAMETSNQ